MDMRLAKYALSSAALALTTVACTPTSQTARLGSLSVPLPKTERKAGAQHAAAQEALLRGDESAALAAAERSVALSPRDVAYRMLLADLYLRAGRFASAEAAFSDVIALQPDHRRAALSLVLVELAQGKTGIATLHLEQIADTQPAADVGLAYALAGQPQRAIDLLEGAARAEGADGRVRQNLALAYAFAGDWQKARVTAAQDVPADQIDDRLAQWARLAQPGDGMTQVAGLLGVTPAAADPGQPVALALRSDPPAAAYAEAVPTEAPVPAAAPVVTVALAPPAPMPIDLDAPAAPATVRYAAAVEALTTPRLIRAALTADPAAAASGLRKPGRYPGQSLRKVAEAAEAIAAPARPVRRQAASRYVVQIGAYRSPTMVAHAWSNAKARYGLGDSGQPVSTSIELPGKGRFYRLSVSGFEDAGAAQSLCRSIRAQRGACFVRASGGDTPTQWALREGGARRA